MRNDVARRPGSADDRDLLDLVDRLVGDDADAARTLVEICHPDLRDFLGRRHASEPDGQADEVLAEFVRRLPDLSFTHRKQVWAYLYRMCRSALSAGNQSWVELPVGLQVSEKVDADPPAELVESQFLVAEVLNGLTESQAQVVKLRFLQGMSVAETATAMGISVNAAKALQHRALRSARQILMLLAAVAAIAAIGWGLQARTASQPLSTDPAVERPDRPEPSVDVETGESGSPPFQVPESDEPTVTGIDTPMTDEPGAVTEPQLRLDDNGPAAGTVDRFDGGLLPPTGGFVDLAAGDTIGAWLVVEPVSLDHATHHAAAAVGQYLDLDRAGAVVRTVDGLEPGRPYEVVISAAVHSRISEATELVELGPNRTVIIPTTSAAVGFDRFAIPFEARSVSTELKLSGLTSSASWAGVVIGDVEVRDIDPGEVDRPLTLIDGFEDGATAPVGGWIDYGVGDQFGAWTVAAGSVSRDHTTHHDLSAAPGHVLDLDGASAVERMVGGLEPGRRYVLSARAGHHSAIPAASAQVIINGVTVTFSPQTTPAEGFQRFDIGFVASADRVTLRLAAVDGSATMGIVIDELRIDGVDR